MGKETRMIPVEEIRLPCLVCGAWFKPGGKAHIFVDTENQDLELPICPGCYRKIAERGADVGNPAWIKEKQKDREVAGER